MLVVNANGDCILPAKENCSCNFILSYAFPLSIAEWNNDFCNWNYQNYIDLFFDYDKELNIDIRLLDGLEYGINERLNTELFEVYHYNEDYLYETIIESIIEALDQGQYMIVFLDENKLGLTEELFIHESMFIGYNLERKIFYILCFANYKYQKREVTFDEVRQSYKSAVDNKGWLKYGWKSHMVTGICFAMNSSYKYSPELAKEKMIDYYEQVGERAYKGIELFEGVSNFLAELYENREVNRHAKFYDVIKTFQAIYQHRVGMRNRIVYYASITKKSIPESELVYMQVVEKRIKLCQLQMMKSYIRDENDAELCMRDIPMIRKSLLSIGRCEKQIWDKLMEVVCNE